MDDLELVPDGPFSRAMAAEDTRAEEAAYRQLDEMGDVPDNHEASQWVSFLRDLDAPILAPKRWKTRMPRKLRAWAGSRTHTDARCSSRAAWPTWMPTRTCCRQQTRAPGPCNGGGPGACMPERVNASRVSPPIPGSGRAGPWGPHHGPLRAGMSGAVWRRRARLSPASNASGGTRPVRHRGLARPCSGPCPHRTHDYP